MSATEEITARLDAKGHEIARGIADETAATLAVQLARMKLRGVSEEDRQWYTKRAGDMAKIAGIVAFAFACVSELSPTPQADAKSGE